MGVVSLVLWCVSLRCWHGWSGGRGVSSAAEDQEWRFLHASSEEVKDTHGQRPATPAHTQVLNQRTLLQPQGTTHTHWCIPSATRAGAAGQSFPGRGVPVLTLRFHNDRLWDDFINVPQTNKRLFPMLFLSWLQLQTSVLPLTSCPKCSRCSGWGIKVHKSHVHQPALLNCWSLTFFYLCILRHQYLLRPTVQSPTYVSTAPWRPRTFSTCCYRSFE